MELNVLLDPGITLQDWPELPIKVSLLKYKHLTLCSLLPQGSIHLAVFTSGTPQAFHAHLDGPFTQFLWEDGNASENLLERNPRLLTRSRGNEICVYGVCAEDGQINLTTLCLCDNNCLSQLCAENHVCIPSSPSVYLLSLRGDDVLLLVSNCVFLHLRFTDEEPKPRLVSALCLELDSEAAERISDVCLHHEILFLLDSLGFIYVFDIVDGTPVTAIELPMRKDSHTVEQLNGICVSPNLDLMIVSSGSSYFLPLSVGQNVGEDAAFSIDMWRTRRQSRPASNSDEQFSSDINSHSLEYGFRLDRSWDAMLSSLLKKTSYTAFPMYPSSLGLVSSLCSTEAPLTWTVSGAGWVKILADHMKDPLRLHSWSLSSFSAVLCIQDIDGHAILARWDMETQGVAYHTLGKALCVDGSDDEACLVITDQGLSLVLFAVPQNEFLKRLMIHGSASTADTLCHLNNWGRCSVPIHTLEAGLENRQLDTVDFFLKSKESILTMTSDDGCVQSEHYLHNVQDLVPALDLLYSYIHNTDQETQSKHFSDQLLQLTLHFLHGQVLTLCDLMADPDSNLEKCLEIVSRYINKLRPFMKKSHPHLLPVQARPAEKGHGAWENMTLENVVSDAILSNCIPEAQAFLRTKGHHPSSLTWVKREGLRLVYKCLLETQVSEACQLLQNMGYSVWDELRRICLHTSNLAVRTLLVNLLEQEGQLSEQEREKIHMVCQIEQMCVDVRKPERGKPNVTHQKPAWKVCNSPSEMQALQNALSSGGDDPGILHLQWAQDWTLETEESVLLPWKNSSDMTRVSPKILWRHLTLWHDWSRIVSWIESLINSDKNNLHSLWPRLSPDIIDDNTLCCGYTRQRILDKLSRMKIFIPSEVNDFESLVGRLAINQQLMGSTALLLENISEFHERFVLMCVERDLQHLLYTYLDHHGLQPEDCSALSSTSLHEAYPWFGFLVHIRQVTGNTNDASRMFHASLSNAHVLIPGYQPSVNSMLLEGHTLLALATSMYASGGIDGVLQQPEEPSDSKQNVDLPLLKMALAPYPKLKAALFPQHQVNSTSPSDISLYHLLQALPPFHPSHFFTWQATNSFTGGDSNTGVPHCSHPQLVTKFSRGEQLDIFFYLRSGRPVVAFSNFLVHQLVRSKFPQQLIQQAEEDVYSLALSYFSSPSIIASIVCFLELLGVSSHKLRVDVCIANLILKHSKAFQEDSGHKSHMQQLARRLSKLVDNETEAAKDLLQSLEEIVTASITEEDSKAPCNNLWHTIVQFCLLHSIPMSSIYLRNFAQKQDWLQLLVHANSQEQVFHALEDLNPVLRSHIALALQDTESADCSVQAVGTDRSTDNVHHVLLKCLSMTEPGAMLLKECMTHRLPLFSVLAACTQDADSISCLCAWIVTSVAATTYLKIMQLLSAPTDNKWNLDHLTQIWDILLENKGSKTLHKAFSIFMEDCPLLVLLEMFELCLEYKNYPEAKERMVEFKKSLEELQSLNESSTSPNPILWLQTRAANLLKLLLLQSRTPYELQNVLQLLCDSASQPLCGGVDIQKLRLLTKIIEDQPFFISQKLLSDYSASALQAECQRLLQILLDGGSFSLAHQVAELAELPTDNLVIEEVLQDQCKLQKTGQWDCPRSRAQYWKKCHEIFNNKRLSPLAASSFFQSQASLHMDPSVLTAERTEFLAEQELLLTLAGHWLSLSDDPPLVTLEELEQQIWKCRIEKEALDGTSRSTLLSGLSAFTQLVTDFSFASLPVLSNPLLLDTSTLPPISGTTHNITETMQSWVLSSLIDKLLDESKVHEASRICRYFQLSHRDVWLVLSCRALASGDMSIHQLHPDIQNILTEGMEAQENAWNRKKRLHSYSSVDSPFQSPTNPVPTYLEILKDSCTHGKMFCRQMLCLYELSQDLGCSFSEISCLDPCEILHTILSSHRPDVADRAHAVIVSHRLPPETVARIVAEESIKLWKTLDKDGEQAEVYNATEKRDHFLQLAKLCPDPTLVGLNLLDHLETFPLTELHCIIEVLISAHDCFSLTCHLEGIGRVLQACRYLTEMHLAPNQEYSLMVRLLSGIGRYNDMVYVFDILHKNQHFEVLLRKKLDTKGGLQTALLEYIKRCHPGDSEKHNMTALCFSMNRDIGHNHEQAAKIQLRLIQSRPWEYWMSELEELRSSIMKALTLLIDAAESYSKDSCVRQSLRCARLSRLLTLQLHLLNNGHRTRLINLDQESLLEPIMALPRFYQAIIVTEAYDVQPDWAEVLYSKVIIGGDFQYLEEFKQRELLKKGIHEQISNKCKLNPPGATGLQNLRCMISYCEDINTRYKLAIENKFYDITDVLMKHSKTRCCLTDMLS